MRALVGVLFILLVTVGFAQEATVVINGADARLNITDKIFFFVDSTSETPLLEINDSIDRHGFYMKKDSKTAFFNAGTATFWGKFSVKNSTDDPTAQIFRLTNYYLDYIDLYEVVDDSILLIGQSGDHRPLDDRTIRHKEHLFELIFTANEEKTFLFQFKRKGNNNIKFYLGSTTEFIESDPNNNLFIGIYVGTILIFAVYAMGIFFFVRKSVYLYYALYILTCGFSLNNVNGMGYKFIYPNAREYSDYFITITAFFSVSFFILFTIQFLNLKSLKPRWYKFIKYYMIGYLFAAVICIYLFTVGADVPILPIHYTLLLLSILLLIISASISLRVNFKSSIYFLISFSPILLGTLFQISAESGYIESNITSQSVLLVTSFLEILIISIGVSMQLREENKERLELSLKVANHEKELSHRLMDGADEEKHRIALVLHDTIGVKLRYLKTLIHKSDQTEAMNELDLLSVEIRDLSHSMAPTILDLVSLQEVMLDLCLKLSDSTRKVNLQVHNFPDDLEKPMKVMLYNSLHELIHNAIKHGDASEITLQFSTSADVLIISLEDNGVGFDLNNRSTGVGIPSIKARLIKFNGEFSLESQVNKGTFCIISIPLPTI